VMEGGVGCYKVAYLIEHHCGGEILKKCVVKKIP